MGMIQIVELIVIIAALAFITSLFFKILGKTLSIVLTIVVWVVAIRIVMSLFGGMF